MTENLRLPTPSHANQLSERLMSLSGEYRVFCFSGELGAGKTTYIKNFCDAMGVESPTSSPSFAIVNEYELGSGGSIYHFDLYRLKNPQELIDIGWYDYLNSEEIILVEWPEIAKDLIPDDAVRISISTMPDESRTVTIKFES